MDSHIHIFVVSMSSFMGNVFPNPKEVDEMDRLPEEEQKDKQSKLPTRWSACSRLIGTLIDGFSSECVDFRIIQYFNLDTTISTGNRLNGLEGIMTTLQSFPTCYKSQGNADVKLAVEEIKRIETEEKYTKRVIHWFIDAEGFSEIDTSIFGKIESEILNLYVIGDICVLHHAIEHVKLLCTVISQKSDWDVVFLLSDRDVEETNSKFAKFDDRSECLIEVEFILAEKSCGVKLTGNQKNNEKWDVQMISLLGFIREIDLNRYGLLTWVAEDDDVFQITPNENTDSDLLWCLAKYMSDEKPMNCALFECIGGNLEKSYCIVAPISGNDAAQIGLIAIRLRDQHYEEWKVLIEDIDTDEIDGKPEELSNEILTAETRLMIKLMKIKLAELENLESYEFEKKFEELRQNYLRNNVEHVFMIVAQEWAQRASINRDV